MTRSSGSPRGGSHALSVKNNLGAVPFQQFRSPKRTSGNSQADTRRPILLHDQHGREWSCFVEYRSGMPTGLIANDFSAPWLPDQAYLVVNPDNPSELWIDYRRMYIDARQALGQYHQLAVQLAADKGWPVPAKRGEYAADIRRVIGNPPRPLQPIKAAAQENPWILGFSDTPDPRLVEYVKPPELLELDMEDEEDYGAEGYADAVIDGADAPPRRVEARPAVADDLDDFEDEDEEEAGEAAGPEALDAIDAELQSPVDGGEDDDAASLLDGLEDEDDDEERTYDPAQLGGRTVQPDKTEIARRQAPRRPAQTSKTRKKGRSRGRGTMKSLRAAEKGSGAGKGVRPSLADGARPAVSAVTNRHAFTASE